MLVTQDAWIDRAREQAAGRPTPEEVRWLDRYVAYDYPALFAECGWNVRDGYRLVAVFNCMHERLELGVRLGKPVGQPVYYLAKQLNMRMEHVSHALHLLCLFGMLRKDELLYSPVHHRPDRYWVQPGVTENDVREVLRRLAAAGITNLRKLTKKNVEEAGFNPEGIYRRGRGPSGHPEEVQWELFWESYEVKHWDEQPLDRIVTSRPERLRDLLPPGCKLKPAGKGVYRVEGTWACAYRVLVEPDLDEYEKGRIVPKARVIVEPSYPFAAYTAFCSHYEGCALDSPCVQVPYPLVWLLRDHLELVPPGYELAETDTPGIYRFQRSKRHIVNYDVPPTVTREGISYRLDGEDKLILPAWVGEYCEEALRSARAIFAGKTPPASSRTSQPTLSGGEFLRKQVGRHIFEVRSRFPETLPEPPEGFEIYRDDGGWYRYRYDFFGPEEGYEHWYLAEVDGELCFVLAERRALAA